MSYEQFRASVSTRLAGSFSDDVIRSMLEAMDFAALDYDIRRNYKEQTAEGTIPEVVEQYLTALAAEKKARSTIDGYRKASKP